MKGLATLIKLKQRLLDEKRREQVNLESQREQLINLSVKLENELQQEREVTANMPEMGAYLADFSKRVQKRQLEITKEVVRIDAALFQVAAAIAEAFGELKKYEIARDNQKEREKQTEKRREDIMLDEVGIQQFDRKNRKTDQ